MSPVVRCFHKQGYVLKTPQPWPDKQDEQLREALTEQIIRAFGQAILGGIDKPLEAQQTTAIGTYSGKRSKSLDRDGPTN